MPRKLVSAALASGALLFGCLPCPQGPSTGLAASTSWHKGATVDVYIVSPSGSGFTDGQISDIETAFANWNSTSGSSLTINNHVVETAPSPSEPYVIVQFGDTSACGAGRSGCTNYNRDPTTTFATFSIINVSTSVGSGGILPLMVHEFGHTYLFADCGCDPGGSVMNPDQIKDTFTAPLECDLRSLYDSTRFVDGGAGKYGLLCAP